MYLNVTKATAIFAFSMLAGSLFAATPAQLGSDCARFTIKGLICIMRIDRFGGFINDQEELGACQNKASNCVQNALDLKTKEELEELFRAALDCLKSMNFKDGSDLVNLNRNDCAHLSFIKFFAIDILENALVGLAQLQAGHLCDFNDEAFGVLVFKGLTVGYEGRDALTARSAAKAYEEVCGAYDSKKAFPAVDLVRWLGNDRFWYDAKQFLTKVFTARGNSCPSDADETH